MNNREKEREAEFYGGFEPKSLKVEQPVLLSRVRDDLGFIKHNDEIAFFTSLIIDLKLQALGREMRKPVTMDRLQEGTKHIAKLMQCREIGLCK